MAEIDLGAAPDGPGTHALVIGVSHYPNLAGDAATEAGLRYGLEDLSSAARSASEVVAWLLNEYRNPGAPLASLRVLLSPAEGETLADGVVERLPASYAATRDAVEADLMAFRAACSERRENVGFVYVAGHGIQLTKRGAIVLLEDFADPGRVELYGAIDMVGCHEGFEGDAYAANQFWFVDACRQLPAIARQFEELEAGVLSLAKPPGEVESSPLFLASASRDVAFAEVGGMTLFSQAVLRGLRGAAAEGPEDDLSLGWHVPAGKLGDVVKEIVGKLAGAKGEEQSVQPTGWAGRAVVHQFEGPPDVRVVLSLEPDEAAAKTKVSLLFDADEAQKTVDGAAEWPLERTLPAGAYQIRVETEAPYAPVGPRLVQGHAARVPRQGQGGLMAQGKLLISFKSSSFFLGQNLPVEVRDASNKLVTRSAGPVAVDLPAGLYVVEATLPGGSRLSEVVAVAAGPPTQLVLSGKKGGAAASKTTTTLPRRSRSGDRRSGRRRTGRICPRPSSSTTMRSSCWSSAAPPGSSTPRSEPDETPVATFVVDGTRISTSLPVNPRGKPEERPCTVTFLRRAGRIRVDVGFVRQRRVAWTLEGMVKSDDSVSTAELFNNADYVLFEKYQDPPAAALGGLTLHRIGRLRERHAWIENLARDFRWVADGRVLLAALLSTSEAPAERARGLAELLEVAPQRPLFTDGLALMVKLLRTWPDEAGKDERRAALSVITSDPATVDWDAMTLTKYDEG